MMKHIHRRVLVIGLALSTGCALRGGPESEPQSRSSAPALVEVSNHNWLDVNVFAVRGGTRERLGMVTSMTTTVLPVPYAFLAGSTSMQLVVDPIGSPVGFSSELLTVWPGQKMTLTIENQISLSQVITTSN